MWRRTCSLSKIWRSCWSLVFSTRFLSSIVKKTVKAVRRVATVHKRKEIKSDLKRIYSCSFGTKESPSIIQSTLDKLLVGCQGGNGKGKHDVKWIWLEKDKPLECLICTQYFKLQIVAPGLGGSPDATGKKKKGIYVFTIYLVMLFIIYYLLDRLKIYGFS
ncbi:hypothetical protein MKX03_010835 [Papaver bracteatum]|nr:hypothetical protein MKX03_010835 [Papaver bracteatum]